MEARKELFEEKTDSKERLRGVSESRTIGKPFFLLESFFFIQLFFIQKIKGEGKENIQKQR
jgi:hypothetical protein